jgi:uncharacterized protein involved in response to NO
MKKIKINILQIVVSLLSAVFAAICSIEFFIDGEIPNGIAFTVASVLWIVAFACYLINFIKQKNE